MQNRKHSIIVNPVSSGGFTGNYWSQIEKEILKHLKLEDYSVHFTEKQGDAIVLALQACIEDVQMIIIVGGDGTISEVIEGIYRSESRPVIGILNMGTGGDFSRSLGLSSDLRMAVHRVFHGEVVSVDTGKVIYTNRTGAVTERYFINVAGCGMAGEVANSVNRSNKRFGAFSYYLQALKKVFFFKNSKVEIKVDGVSLGMQKIVTAAVCNGQFFGGGMMIAPLASIKDGLLNLTVIGNWGVIRKISYSPFLYTGGILSLPGVTSYLAKEVEIIPANHSKLMVDIDGESPGYIPMKVSVHASSLQIRI